VSSVNKKVALMEPTRSLHLQLLSIRLLVAVCCVLFVKCLYCSPPSQQLVWLSGCLWSF